MNNYTTLKKDVEAEYEAYCASPDCGINGLCEKLYPFLNYMVRKFIGKNAQKEDIDDVVSETMEVIVSKALQEFEKKEAEFSTYCAAIAKNKVGILWKKNNRELLDVDGELEERLAADESRGSEQYLSPERQILLLESRLEQIVLVKKYIKALMDWKQKPYRTVSCVFSMLLFHRYHPKTKELASPKWAYEELVFSTVSEGAERFLVEMQGWFPNDSLLWSSAFIDGMDEMEDGSYIGDIVFGKRFKLKDFENWCLRLRQAIKKQLLETEVMEYAAFEL